MKYVELTVNLVSEVSKFSPHNFNVTDYYWIITVQQKILVT